MIAMLDESTAYIERSYLASRFFNGRQARRTLAFSKEPEMIPVGAIWGDIYYNLVRPHKSLRIPDRDGSLRHWQSRTPAMAAELTDHIWTAKELLTTLPLPKANDTL